MTKLFSENSTIQQQKFTSKSIELFVTTVVKTIKLKYHGKIRTIGAP
jgi:hypothetical protein